MGPQTPSHGQISNGSSRANVRLGVEVDFGGAGYARCPVGIVIAGPFSSAASPVGTDACASVGEAEGEVDPISWGVPPCRHEKTMEARRRRPKAPPRRAKVPAAASRFIELREQSVRKNTRHVHCPCAKWFATGRGQVGTLEGHLVLVAHRDIRFVLNRLDFDSIGRETEDILR